MRIRVRKACGVPECARGDAGWWIEVNLAKLDPALSHGRSEVLAETNPGPHDFKPPAWKKGLQQARQCSGIDADVKNALGWPKGLEPRQGAIEAAMMHNSIVNAGKKRGVANLLRRERLVGALEVIEETSSAHHRQREVYAIDLSRTRGFAGRTTLAVTAARVPSTLRIVCKAAI
jgi:hypothetical protein